MEQIKRCDIHPEGWFSSAGGPNPDAPSTWTCTNMTIDRVGEMPQNCQYSTFWGFPDDMKYAGPAVLNGVSCDQWTYFSQGDEYTLYATMLDEVTGESIPVVRLSVVSSYHFIVITIYYINLFSIILRYLRQTAKSGVRPMLPCGCCTTVILLLDLLLIQPLLRWKVAPVQTQHHHRWTIVNHSSISIVVDYSSLNNLVFVFVLYV